MGKKLGRTYDRILETDGQIAAGIPADKALKHTFKRARDLGPSERQEVSETIHQLLRSGRRIDDLLDRAARAEKKTLETIEPPMRARLRLLALYADSGMPLEEIEARDQYAFRRVPGAIARIATKRVPDTKRSPLEALAISVSFPTWIVERLATRFGPERTLEICTALNRRAPVTVRVNSLKASRDEAARRIESELGVTCEPTARSPLGLILSGPADIQASALFDEGWIELQDEGSQLIAIATGAAPKETVLDACAGAGGKTLAIGAMMESSGRLVALDPEDRKLQSLKSRARRAGLTNIETFGSALEALEPRFKEAFDRVLVDAPCTGTGILRRHPDLRSRVIEQEVAVHTARQLRLISGAASALRSGGLVVYATCSILWEENEGVVARAIANDPRLEMEREERIGPGPGERDPDGFYLALLKRR